MSEINKADFTPNAPNFKELVLLSFQGLTNFPYIEEDFDALTNYGLLSKVIEYLNEVISNNNEQNDLMTGLYNAYVELQDYVNDYFDNLDVQEEINNKLDDMAQDGTLTTLIGAYVDPRLTQFQDNVNEQLSIMNSKVNAAYSGSPLVASSTSQMSDTSRVYVNTTDGKWYFYDGDSWEIGGTYQASEDSYQVAENTENIKILAVGDVELSFDWAMGGYDTNDGKTLNPLSTTRIYEERYIKGDGHTHLTYDATTGYQLWFFEYDSDTNFIQETGYSYDFHLDFLLEEDKLYRFNIYKGDGIDLETAIENIQFKKYYDITNNKYLNDIELHKTFYIGATREYTKLKDGIAEAVKYQNSLVYVDEGTYDLIDEYGSSYFENYTYSQTDCGIILKNNIHVIFSPKAKVTCNYTGSNTDVMTYFSPFNTGAGGFTLDGLNLDASKVRYGIHDDIAMFSNSHNYLKTEYNNCYLKFSNIENTARPNYNVIGGGLGYNADVLINNCFIETDANLSGTTNGGISYHQNGTTGAKSRIVVNGCYFVNNNDRVNFTTLGQTQEITNIICSNNSGKILPYKQVAPNTTDSMNLILINNIVR